jgi:hypothetical protein
MRSELKKIELVRQTFIGEFERYGEKPNWNGYLEKTILFKNIKDSEGNLMTDHIWFTVGKRIESLQIKSVGTLVQFDARVKPYIKGYVNFRQGIDERTRDFKLNNPTNFKVITQF